MLGAALSAAEVTAEVQARGWQQPQSEFAPMVHEVLAEHACHFDWASMVMLVRAGVPEADAFLRALEGTIELVQAKAQSRCDPRA